MALVKAQQLANLSLRSVRSSNEWSIAFIAAADEFASSDPLAVDRLVFFKKSVGSGLDSLIYVQQYVKAIAGVVIAAKGSTPYVRIVAGWGDRTLADLGTNARIIYSQVLEGLIGELI